MGDDSEEVFRAQQVSYKTLGLRLVGDTGRYRSTRAFKGIRQIAQESDFLLE